MTPCTAGLTFMIVSIQLGSYTITFLKNPGLATFIAVEFRTNLTPTQKQYFILGFIYLEKPGAKPVKF